MGKNHFDLFGLPVRFGIDLDTITERYRELQRATHPDQFATATEQEKNLAVQQAALVNDAYQTLKSPLKRAQYMLELQGNPLNESDTQMDPIFLLEQMELREALEYVPDAEDPFATLDKIRDALKFEINEMTRLVAEQLDRAGDPGAAQESVKKMQFMYKVQQELTELEERLAEQI